LLLLLDKVSDTSLSIALCLSLGPHDCIATCSQCSDTLCESFACVLIRMDGSPAQLVNRTGLPIVVGQKWTASSVTLIGGQQPVPAGGSDMDEKLHEAVVAVAGGGGSGASGRSLSGSGPDLLGVLTGDSPEAQPRIFSLGPKVCHAFLPLLRRHPPRQSPGHLCLCGCFPCFHARLHIIHKQ
jgi:hypothetical protein